MFIYCNENVKKSAKNVAYGRGRLGLTRYIAERTEQAFIKRFYT
jgi:hypothetical protein